MGKIYIEHKVTPAKLDVLYVDDWPVWSKEISEFDWTYDNAETCYVIEGKTIYYYKPHWLITALANQICNAFQLAQRFSRCISCLLGMTPDHPFQW